MTFSHAAAGTSLHVFLCLFPNRLIVKPTDHGFFELSNKKTAIWGSKEISRSAGCA